MHPFHSNVWTFDAFSEMEISISTVHADIGIPISTAHPFIGILIMAAGLILPPQSRASGAFDEPRKR